MIYFFAYSWFRNFPKDVLNVTKNSGKKREIIQRPWNALGISNFTEVIFNAWPEIFWYEFDELEEPINILLLDFWTTHMLEEVPTENFKLRIFNPIFDQSYTYQAGTIAGAVFNIVQWGLRIFIYHLSRIMWGNLSNIDIFSTIIISPSLGAIDAVADIDETDYHNSGSNVID